jgi:hypothetical protein
MERGRSHAEFIFYDDGEIRGYSFRLKEGRLLGSGAAISYSLSMISVDEIDPDGTCESLTLPSDTSWPCGELFVRPIGLILGQTDWLAPLD